MLKSLIIRLALRYGPEIVVILLKEFSKRTGNKVDDSLALLVERVLKDDPRVYDSLKEVRNLSDLKVWNNHVPPKQGG